MVTCYLMCTVAWPRDLQQTLRSYPCRFRRCCCPPALYMLIHGKKGTRKNDAQHKCAVLPYYQVNKVNYLYQKNRQSQGTSP